MITEEEYLSEAKRINEVEDVLKQKLGVVEEKIGGQKIKVNEALEYITSQFASMDKQEKASASGMLEQADVELIQLVDKRAILKRQIDSPYFGRIDFVADDTRDTDRIYVGVAHLSNEKDLLAPYICDWRAPICSMYYDYEKGRAKYSAPLGDIEGEITLKRQYKIKGGALQFVFDSDLTIGDDILQQTLSQNVDSKMKNIVSTIQKEQNKIIRGDIAQTLIVQGVAGSGKTSIALHRVAFLLYKYKDKIRSKDIMIISPNKIFSDYISNVLPELGEQNICEITFKEIAFENLRDDIVFEDREDMLEDLIKGNTHRRHEIEKKTSKEFCDNLQKYLKEKIVAEFEAEDIVVGDCVITKEKLNELYYERYKDLDVAKRIDYIADYCCDEINFTNEHGGGVYSRLKNRLYKMFKNTNLIEIYENFLATQDLVFEFSDAGVVKYEDVAPIMFIKDYFVGLTPDKSVKYLLIDEMQDYSPIHFLLFNKIYKCPKTILGDIYQCFDRDLGDDYLQTLKNIYGTNSLLLYMNKSYRSTVEIAHFAQKILGLEGVDNVNRHGTPVEIRKCENKSEMLARLEDEIKSGLNKNYSRIAIIAKDDEEAKELYKIFDNKLKCVLLSKQNTLIETGVIFTSSGMSKGLEFDEVIIPNCDATNYETATDKKVLYISATRALHELVVLSSKELTKFIKEN